MKASKVPRVRIAAACLFLSGILAPPSFAEYREDNGPRPQAPQYVPNELIVKFNPGAVSKSSEGTVEFLAESLHALAERFPIESMEPVFRTAAPESDLGRTYKITFSETQSADEVRRAFQADPSVDYAEPNFIYETQNQLA